MRKSLLLLLSTVMLFSLIASAETWNNVNLIDSTCARKMAANPDAHPRDCAIKCAQFGYGIITSDGRFLKFDTAGNKQALDLLKSTDKKDHLRLNVTGGPEGRYHYGQIRQTDVIIELPTWDQTRHRPARLYA